MTLSPVTVAQSPFFEHFPVWAKNGVRGPIEEEWGLCRGDQHRPQIHKFAMLAARPVAASEFFSQLT